MKIKLWGGVGEIGGNIVEIEAGGERVILDFGQSFSRGNEYFYEFLKPRIGAGLLDYLEFDLIPPLPGLYDPKLLRLTNLEVSDPRFAGVFISHAHGDHCMFIKFLHPEIPLYMGETTRSILEVVETTSHSFQIGEHRNLACFRTGSEISIGNNFLIRPVHVDHSVPGAYGFIVETPDGYIVYSGDIRFHGPLSRLSQDFVEKALKVRPKALILEGTRVDSSRKDSEERVFNDCLDKVKQTRNLVVVGVYPKDLDRLHTFYRISRECGRKLAIPLKTACVIDSLKEDPHLDLARHIWEDKENVFVHFHRAKSGDFLEKDYRPCILKDQGFSSPERACLRERRITAEEIGKRQEEYIWVLDFFHLTELVEAKPKPGSLYLFSMSEILEDPIDELESEILKNWCQRFNLEYFVSHASGHACREELADLVNSINPEVLIPIHTVHPQKFLDFFPKVIFPERGKSIML
ncbi:MAG: MBL fold metallo-hydrolase [Caldiserica bacterium]|jgi:ribonuclease J|nr:MBL fold metallo-hydrolase [Caldisericota bacterium]MDH7562028.1 MBL fold metallo-hydrolase [Caldisericota bacterium]